MSVLFNISSDTSSKIVLESDSVEDLNYVFNSSHSDVVAAYSFRRLSPDYYGALVEVKAGSETKDFYPLGNGKIDIDELLSFIGTSNGSIVRFYNQAANSKVYDNPLDTYTSPDITTGNAYAKPIARQPQIIRQVEETVAVLSRKNGLISAPLLQVIPDNTDPPPDPPLPPTIEKDWLRVNSNTSNKITGDMFAYFVGSHDGTSSNNAMFSKRLDDSNKEYEFIYTSPTNVRYSDSTGSVDLTVSASSDLRIHSFSRDKTNNDIIDLQVNETFSNGNNLSGTINTTTSKLYIGARPSEDYEFLGDFQELVIFNSYKDVNEKAAILNKVNKYYNAYTI